MSDIKIKICGLTRAQDMQYVNEALPDYIGFVFAKSRRQVGPREAAELKSLLDCRIKAVGVFVNEDIPAVSDLCGGGVIDFIQLHGDENSEYIAGLRESLLKRNCLRPIIKAVRVRDAESVKSSEQYRCDYLLLDAHSGAEYGGTGRTFDWELCRNVRKPFFLAGGLNPENVISAVDAVRPYCLDVSSGVETGGFKDKDKIIKLVNMIRGV